MLQFKKLIPRALAYRGITTTASRNHTFIYPDSMSNKEVLERWADPNHNDDYCEDWDQPFTPAPRLSNLDPTLNLLREKIDGDWSNITPTEAKILYDAHYMAPLWTFVQPDDTWKFAWAQTWIHTFGWMLMMFIICDYFGGELMDMPECFDDPHYLNECLKHNLMNGLTQNHIHYDYDEKKWIKPRWYRVRHDLTTYKGSGRLGFSRHSCMYEDRNID